MSELAVIIPAFKNEYFFRALQSLSCQTCKDFKVYIGDDFSPHNLKQIVDEFEDKLTISYTRFHDNIGSKNIVNQWKRCVALSLDEPWIWLFSDDDIADQRCVENFYTTRHLQQDKFDVYRFNTCVIDANDQLTSCTPVGPQIETSEEMAFHLLMGKRGNSMPDHIFSRQVYHAHGGFVFTRYAQGADWATSMLFSQKNGICIIPDALLYWRVSGQNISSLASVRKMDMMHGHFDFIHWILNHFQYLKTKDFTITYDMIRQAATRNLISTMISHYGGLEITSIRLLYSLFHKTLQLSPKRSLISLLTILISSHTVMLRMYELLTVKLRSDA